MSPTSTAAQPAFVTIAIRPSSLGRVAATHTPFPNFGKVEYFRRHALTDTLGVLPVRQRRDCGSPRHSGARRRREPGIHFAARDADRWIPGSMLHITPE
jgi:hypothetical protein